MLRSDVVDGLKPYFWLALVAFLIGFMSYLALGPGLRAPTRATYVPAASAPASEDWNLPKHI